MKKVFFALIIAASSAAPALAFDRFKFAQHLRETLNLDTRTSIEVQGEPRPAPIGDLNKVTVLVGGAPYDVYVTKDESTYLWGFAADLTTSPDAKRAAGIDLKTGHAIGSANAPVTVVEYSDFACGFCRRAHEILKTELHKAYPPSKVRWVYKHYPLTTHPWALTAAVASECASRQKPDAFWKMADHFFATQESITEENVAAKSKAHAKTLGLKEAPFNVCMEDGSVRELVNAQKREGAAIGVQSTPTLFINGRLRRGFRDFGDIKVVIDEKLKALGK